MKIISIVGARPQFIKVKPIAEEFARHSGIKHVIVHTGQHYDYEMSRIFFQQLRIPIPKYNLSVGSGFHGQQTAAMLERIEQVLFKEKPCAVLVYGDTNSTLAGALAAVKLHLPVVHVEAGLRSYRMDMPEEINRVLIDRVSSILFCPTRTAVKNLKKENVRDGVYLTGDVMLDIFLQSRTLVHKRKILSEMKLKPREYLLLTIHRQENTDNPKSLKSIFSAFTGVEKTVVFPVHPRLRKVLRKIRLKTDANIVPIKPVGYMDMLALEKDAQLIVTDSGGVQKEAFWSAVPCVTLRQDTEWIETVRAGWNILCGTDSAKIKKAISRSKFSCDRVKPQQFGQGNSSAGMVRILLARFTGRSR